MPLRVVALDLARQLALCADRNGHRETVEIALVAPVAIGDELLVHAGTAISKVAGGQASPAGTDAGAQGESPAEGEGKVHLRERSQRAGEVIA